MASQLPIFELPLVLLPGELLPLHIFEDRYKRMIGGCLETGEPFGVLYRDAEGARSLGCTARVTEILERLDDGRLNVIVTGGEPFRVLNRFDDPDEPSAEVEAIDDEGSTATEQDHEAARRAFAELAEQASGQRPPDEDLSAADAYDLAARVELPADTKQDLLGMRDEGERLRALTDVLRQLRQLLERAGDVAERARSNGKIRIGP